MTLRLIKLTRMILTLFISFLVPNAESNTVTYRHYVENGISMVEETMVVNGRTMTTSYRLPENLPANNPYLNPSYDSKNNAIPLQPIYQGTVIDTTGVQLVHAPTLAPLPTVQPLPTLMPLPTLPSAQLFIAPGNSQKPL